MKALLVGALVIGGLIPYAVHAQRGGTHGGAVGQPGFGAGGMARRQYWGEVWQHWGKFGDGRFGGRNQRGGFPGSGSAGLGLGFAGYGWAPDYGWGFGGYSGLYEGSWFPKQYGNEGPCTGRLMLMQAPHNRCRLRNRRVR